MGETVDDMDDYSDKMKEDVLDGLNKTNDDLANFSIEFEECKQHMAVDADMSRSDFDTKVRQHTTCRYGQQSADDLLDSCEKLRKSQETIKKQECNSPTLKQPIG